MDTDELTDQLESMLASREAGLDYRVERVLKDGSRECTQVVYLLGAGGGEYGPFVHKVIAADRGFGTVYRTLHDAWLSGRRFAHLPEIMNVSSQGDELDVLMEYVEGPTLEVYLTAAGFDRGVALHAFEDVCRACIELHASFAPPIIHRDLKPSNIIIAQSRFSSQLTAVLIDFGIARQWREGESSDTVHFGTREFAPPEQYGFSQTTVRSDVYALGMLLAYCLIGSTVPCEQLVSSLTGAHASAGLIRVVERACAFDPADRYDSVQALLDAFSAAVGAGDLPSSGQRGDASSGKAVKDSLFMAPSSTLTPQRPQAPRAVHARFIDRPFIRIPWNIAVLFVAAASVQATIELVAHPTESMKDASIPALVVIAYFMVLPIFLFVCWLLYNKSWLRKRFAFVDWAISIGLPRLIARFVALEAAALVAALLLWSV